MPQFTATLECRECDAISTALQRGWRASLTVYDTDERDEPGEVVVLCPSCSAREFGDD